MSNNAPTTVYYTFQPDWDDFGSWVPEPEDYEKYVDYIASHLHPEIAWCGDELIGPCDVDDPKWDYDQIDQTMKDIMRDAFEHVFLN